jgi:hypothetical protein
MDGEMIGHRADILHPDLVVLAVREMVLWFHAVVSFEIISARCVADAL